jgi:hypothetical protein
MKYISLLSFLATLILGVVPCSAAAQSLYRCGNTYQDKPCEKGDQKVVGLNRAAAANEKPALDLSCARLGEQAKKIIWMREGGALKEKLLSEASSEEQRKLIVDVYSIRGNSADVRGAIENDCMAQKANDRLLGKLATDSSSASTPKKSGAAEQKAEVGKSAAGNQDANDKQKKQLCSLLRNQISSARDAQRTGASPDQQDAINQQKRDLESQLKTNGCDAGVDTQLR